MRTVCETNSNLRHCAVGNLLPVRQRALTIAADPTLIRSAWVYGIFTLTNKDLQWQIAKAEAGFKSKLTAEPGVLGQRKGWSTETAAC